MIDQLVPSFTESPLGLSVLFCPLRIAQHPGCGLLRLRRLLSWRMWDLDAGMGRLRHASGGVIRGRIRIAWGDGAWNRVHEGVGRRKDLNRLGLG